MAGVELPETRVRVRVKTADDVVHQLLAWFEKHGSLGTVHLDDKKGKEGQKEGTRSLRAE